MAVYQRPLDDSHLDGGVHAGRPRPTSRIDNVVTNDEMMIVRTGCRKAAM
jgi:hypothetical protein